MDKIVRLSTRRRRPQQRRPADTLVDMEAELRSIEIAISALVERRKGVLSNYRRALKRAFSAIFVLLILTGSTTSREGGRTFRHHPGVASLGPLIFRHRRPVSIPSRP